MPNIINQEPVAKKLLPIIYVLDTSGSMAGDRITSVNAAMNETVDVLRDVSKNNPTAELKIGVLQFSSGAKWITDNGFVFMEDFFWNDLSAGGLTDFGSALSELDKKLSRSEYLDSDVGYKVPVIIFMTDGEPTDNYEAALAKVNANNKWFKAATKIAIAVGDDANVGVLEKIVGNKEAILKVDDHESLKRCIKVVSVTASMVGSKSRTNSDASREIIDGVKGTVGEGGGITIIDPVDPPENKPADPGVDPWPGGWEDEWD